MGETTELNLQDMFTNAGDGIVDVFIDSLPNIFAHVKADIVNACEKLDTEALTLIRDKLYDKLLTTLPNSVFCQDHKLFVRRNKNLLIEDIFVLGYSIVSKSEERRLKKVMKPASANNITLSTEDDNQITKTADKDIYETCIILKTTVNSLMGQVSNLCTSVKILEEEVTTLRTRDPSVDGNRRLPAYTN